MFGAVLSAALPIVGWWGVPEAEVSRERYREAREAGFTHLMQHADSIGQMRQFLDLADTEGLKLVVWLDETLKNPEAVADGLKDHPALAMYHIKDEPKIQDIPALGDVARRVAARDPKHPCYMNLFADASTCMGCTNYFEYVACALREFPPPVFSADYYPCILTNRTLAIPYRDEGNQVVLRERWFNQLEYLSKTARQHGRELGLFACDVAHDVGDCLYPVPTLAMLRLQQYANLAYGAKLLQYFTYWNPNPNCYAKFHESIIRRDGTRGEVYELVKKLNRELQARAFVFAGAQVLDVSHTGKTIPLGTHRLQRLPRWVKTLSTGDDGAVVSVMRKGNVEILQVVNRSPVRELALDIDFECGARRVSEDGTVSDVARHSRRFWLSPGFAEIFIARPVTPGWENVNADRTEFPPAQEVWRLSTDDVKVEMENGAEGEVRIDRGKISVRKTNDRGRIVLSAPSFVLEKGRRIRLFADVSVRCSRPMDSRSYLRAHGLNRSIDQEDSIGAQWFAAGGVAMMRNVNSAPGMTYRKYAHFESDGSTVTPVIVVEGFHSETTWRNWAAEDLDAAQTAWERHFERLASPDRSSEMADEQSFSDALAADIEHSAEIRSVDGVSRLFVDGVETPPIIYKAPGCEWEIKDRLTYSGKPLQRHGIKLGVINLRLGKLPTMDGPWSEKGFDVKAAAETVRRDMRIADESCFILAIGTSAYPKFTDEHPDETWRKEDGSVVRGNSGSAIPDVYNDGGKPDPGDVRWPWVSYASPSWRKAIKDLTAELVGELRRTGLIKRIVGVHYYGYHDGQFALPVADHSACAKADYAKYLAENGYGASDPEFAYSCYIKQLGFRTLEDFSREAKRLFGKPIVAVRWVMSPFGPNPGMGSYDVTAFVRSDAVDVIVPQPDYHRRLPGLAQGVRLPCNSLHLHGKMMWHEFDLRTYGALDGWAQSVVATKGLGQSDDLTMWKTVFRKHAGIVNAQRMGWWFYDMAGGWFHPEEIAADCGEVYALRKEFEKRIPDPWHPDLALVIDEAMMATYNCGKGPKVSDAVQIVNQQWSCSACAGVPYDSYLAADFYANPELARRYKALMLAGFVVPDRKQESLFSRLDEMCIRTLVIPSGGCSPETVHDFAADSGCFVATRPGVLQLDMNGDFISVHCLVTGEHDVKLPFVADVVNLKDGSVAAEAGSRLELSMTAGETCWFGVRRK